MSTVATIINRVFSEYLTRTDDRPHTARLTTTLDDSETSVVYDAGMLAPEADLIGAGVLIELGLETMEVTAHNTTTRTFTVIRGVDGSTATAHTSGAEIRIAPKFKRSSVFDAVCDDIVNLAPSLTRTGQDFVVTGTGFLDMDSTAIRATDLWYGDGDSWAQVTDLRTIRNAPESTTGVSVVVPPNVPKGRAAYVNYTAKFTRPTAETDTWVTLGIDAAWVRIVVVGAVASLMVGGVDFGISTREFITESLAAAGSQFVSSGRDLQKSLLSYREYLLNDASQAQTAQQDDMVAYVETYLT